DPAAERGEVVVGAADANGEQGGAELLQPRAEFLGAAAYPPRDLDLGRVTAEGGAVLPQDGGLALEGFRVAEAVPDIGVPGDQAQGLLLAAAADEHRDLAGRGGVQLGQPRLDPG